MPPGLVSMNGKEWYKGWAVERLHTQGDNSFMPRQIGWKATSLRGLELRSDNLQKLKNAIEKSNAERRKAAPMNEALGDTEKKETKPTDKPEVSPTQKLKDKGVTPWWIKKDSTTKKWSSYSSSQDEKENASQRDLEVAGPFLSKVDADKHASDRNTAAQKKEVEEPVKKEHVAIKRFGAFLTEGPSRKDFQMVADLIKSNPDAAKRRELAKHHADIFSQQNPRFDRFRFFAACDAVPGKIVAG